MLKIDVDFDTQVQCQDQAKRIVSYILDDIQNLSSTSVERSILRLLYPELDKLSKDGEVPIYNTLVEKWRNLGILEYGAVYLSIFAEKNNIDLFSDSMGLINTLATDYSNLRPDDEVLAKFESRLNLKANIKKYFDRSKYVIIATGNIKEDAVQAVEAARQGADIIAVIRSTAQSLLDYVPQGITTEGFGGTYATQANFRYLRSKLNEVEKELGRHICLVNYASGLCMPEITVCAIQEGLDILLNDSMYGILFRDINPRRTFVDQFFSRRLCAQYGIVINTGEDNYLTTDDALTAAHTVIASQYINKEFAHRAGMEEWQLGLGHAFEIDPDVENSFLYELAHALLIRVLFPNCPIKYMPPTRYKSGNIFYSLALDTMFDMASSFTGQSIHLLGMLTEAIHTPFLQDRKVELDVCNYVFKATAQLMNQFDLKSNSLIQNQADKVLRTTCEFLTSCTNLYQYIEEGKFAGIKRPMSGGHGGRDVFIKHDKYIDIFTLSPLREHVYDTI